MYWLLLDLLHVILYIKKEQKKKENNPFDIVYIKRIEASIISLCFF